MRRLKLGFLLIAWIHAWVMAAFEYRLCHPDDLIASKVAANRQKDREVLPRLRSFREYWLRQQRNKPV